MKRLIMYVFFLPFFSSSLLNPNFIRCEGEFNAKLGTQNILKPTIWNASIQQEGNDNGVGIVNFAISINLIAKRTMFLHRHIH
jgi:hypothetical protein